MRVIWPLSIYCSQVSALEPLRRSRCPYSPEAGAQLATVSIPHASGVEISLSGRLSLLSTVQLLADRICKAGTSQNPPQRGGEPADIVQLAEDVSAGLKTTSAHGGGAE